MAKTPSDPKPEPRTDVPPDTLVVKSEDIFRGTREVCIEHAGERYRLRITRRNKLLLQK
jgi:hemin uptake protein HemP